MCTRLGCGDFTIQFLKVEGVGSCSGLADIARHRIDTLEPSFLAENSILPFGVEHMPGPSRGRRQHGQRGGAHATSTLNPKP